MITGLSLAVVPVRSILDRDYYSPGDRVEDKSYHVYYSGKFSLVQTFAELLVSSLEEIFVVLIFASPSAIAAHAPHQSVMYAYTRIML